MTASRDTPRSEWATNAHWRESSMLHDDALVFSDTSQSGSLFTVSDFIVPDLQLQYRYEDVHSSEGSGNLPQAVTTKKRTRRVIAPVSGNNKVGKRGKIRCTECRRIHCIFDSDETKCENCSSKNFECVKVWGPKTESWLNTVVSRINESVPPSVPLITETNLTYQENWRLRRIYQYTIENPDQRQSIILQHLWSTCSKTFDNDALLYSILAWDAGRDMSRTSITELDQYNYRFQNRLRQALQRDSVTELHLFAIIFAVFGAQLRNSPELQRTLAVHLKGMAPILHHLNSPKFQHKFRLRYLHHFAVSSVRSQMFKSVYENAYEIHLATQSIPLPLNLPDHRVGAGLPVQFWDKGRDRVPSRAIEWAVLDALQGLYGCFQKLLVWERNRSETDFTNIASLVRSIRNHAERIKMLPTISNDLEKLQNGEKLDTVPRGWSTSANNEWLLWGLFRLLALLELMETTFLLITDTRRVQQLIITGFALVRNRPSLTLYATLGLLLRAPFLEEMEVFHRQWELRRIWKCLRCGSSLSDVPESRVEAFWASKMSTRDCVQFLSDNMLIWELYPNIHNGGWADSNNLCLNCQNIVTVEAVAYERCRCGYYLYNTAE